MKTKIISLVLAFVVLFSLTSSASAQANYSFALTKEDVHVFLNQDGTVALDYILTFDNDPGASPIDVIDLGLPNGDYDFNSISATSGGNSLNISSDYQGSGTGVAVELGQYAIQDKGSVRIYVGRVSNLFFPDSDDQAYASSEFSPSYFSSKFVHGNTDLSVSIHLPPGVKPEEPKYHLARGGWPGAAEPATMLDGDGRATYYWTSDSANAYTEYIFGASFPKQYIPESAIVVVTFWDLVVGFIGTIAGFLPFCFFGLLFFGIPVLSAISDRKRKLQYIKPTISIEGHGIKRGLTAVEAAILMGQPLNKIMTMLLFSTVKKGALEVASKSPIKVNILQQVQGLHEYEQLFVAAMVKEDRERRKDLQAMTVALVKSVTEKMRGFSRKETLDYYASINEKAWQQITAAGTPEVQSQVFEEALEWTMLDKDYDDRARRTFHQPVFLPNWWGRYDPVFRGSTTTHTSTPMNMPSMSSGSAGRASLPGADFAATVVGGVQDFSGRVLGNLNDFTSGVTKVTNPPPPPSQSSGGRSSSGGCACACAGCACACAGGGR
jgi:hypothetical protein